MSVYKVVHASAIRNVRIDIAACAQMPGRLRFAANEAEIPEQDPMSRECPFRKARAPPCLSHAMLPSFLT